ncbi:MAG: hypothetical protein ACRDUA_06465 [Micromonosporaceae bacterium]
MFNNRSNDRRRMNGGQVREALERYAEARRELTVATRDLHQAELVGDPRRVIAAADRVRAATATERFAYRHAIELLDRSTMSEPDPGHRPSPRAR